MKKNLFLLTSSLLFVLSLVFVNPAQAQSPSFNFVNIFTGFKNSLQRLYLKTIPGPKSGQAVIKQSFYQLQQVESLYYEATIQIQEEGETQTPTSANLTISGPATVQNLYQPQSGQQAVTIEGEFAAEGETSNFAADLVTQDKTLYFRLKELPTNLGNDFTSFTEKWISLPLEMDSAAEIEDETLSDKQQQQLTQTTLDLLEQAQLSQARPDSLNGASVFVIDVSFDQKILLNYLEEVNRITEQTLTAEERQQLEKQLAQITPLNFTLWIGQADFYPRQVETSLQLTDLEISEDNSLGLTPFNQGLTPEAVQLQLQVNFSQFNQPVEISAPESAQSLNQIFGQMMGFEFDSGELPEQLPADLMPGTIPQVDPATPAMPDMEALEQQQQDLLKQYGL